MATYDYAIGSGVGMPNKAPYCITVQRLLDFAVIAAARSAASLTALAQSDVIQALHVPADVYVLAVGVKVITAEGEAATIDVGDGTDTDGYLNDLDCNATGHTLSLITTAFSVAVGGGKIYTAADTIDILLNTSITWNLAKIMITAQYADFRLIETQSG